MPKIIFACACGEQYRADSSLAGRAAQCKKCGRRVRIPGLNPSSQPAQSTAPSNQAAPVASPVSSIGYECPHCGMGLEVDCSYAGQEAQCGACHGRTIVPNRRSNPERTVATPPPPVLIPVVPVNQSGITVPVLISAIVNIFVGAFWVCTACGIVLGVPMLILAVFEFILYSQADDIRPQELIERAESIAIFQIICGLFNLGSLICGIIVLINAGKYKRRIRSAGHHHP